ncbi:MAG: flagellar hook-associated protein FlgK [Planctomyces sp.]|nr:flagellar hook-associated protein FlgK [Planctomyces sp.]
MSLNGALAVAARSLEIFSAGVQVASNNIANANTPGYVRDAVSLTPAGSYKSGSLLVGSGVSAIGVRQQLDSYLESRIHSANTSAASSSVKSSVWQRLEVTLNALGDEDLASQLNSFVTQLQTLSGSPDSAGQRQIALQESQGLVDHLTFLRGQVDDLRTSLNDQVTSQVEEANRLINQIANLNPKISSLEANGLNQSDAGALRVERLNAINRLSELIPVKVIERPSGQIDLYSGSDYIILDGHTQNLRTVPSTDGEFGVLSVETTVTRSFVANGGGEIQGTMEARDEILGGFTKQLDQLAAAVIHETNRIHSQGEGLEGYATVTGTYAVEDANAALNSDAAGLFFDPQHGNFTLKVRNTTSGETTESVIAIDLDGIGTETSLNDLVASLNAVGQVTAQVTADGKLQISAASGYELRFGNDSSGVLASLGINTLFTGTDSGNIGVNQTVAGNQKLLATGKGGGPGDSSNAVLLSKVLTGASKQLGGLSITQFQDNLVGGVAQSSSAEQAVSKGFTGFRDSLLTQREQISGVSIDEETLNIMNLQRTYQASARIITVVDELFNTLLNI